jgi:diguanylate cyclase (GGDEF)-like protein
MRVQIFFVAAAMLLGGGAVYASYLIAARQEALGRISRYNLAWTAGQAAQEVSRLQAAIGAFNLSHGEAERQSLEMWLELVEGRAAALRTGETGAFIRSHDELLRAVGQLDAAIEMSRPLLQSLDEPRSVAQLMRSFNQINASMARLSSVAHAHGTDLAAQDAQQLDELHWLFSRLLLGLILCCLGLTATASWRNRLLAKSNAEVKARDVELRRQNQLFDAALNNMSQGLGMFDAEHRLIVSNRRFSELFRLAPAAAKAGVHAADLLAVVPGTCEPGRMAGEFAWSRHQELAARSEASTFIQEEEGRSLSISHQPLADGGWVTTYEDVTESRRAEAQIRHLADHDALTGLPNRRQFSKRLHEALRYSDRDVAVLFLDLDHFKNVNDTLGHQAGDALLRSAADRIRGCLREGDLVARQGGDEFAVLVQGRGAQPGKIEDVAGRIIEALGAPFELAQYQASVSVSIGIAIATAPFTVAETLLKHADMALYKAKAAGRRTYRTFEVSMAAELQVRMELEADLRGAPDRNELEVHYQPLLNLHRGQLSGFEALLRWRHPVRGMVSPAEFIPVSEETGLIVQIGEWTLRRACADAATFPGNAKVSVNISPVQFASGDLYAVVQDALVQSGLAAARLELEITESALLQDSEAVLGTLHRLRALGVRVALDDFGTKYSSLTYLRSFPFDKIKIDQSFVRDMSTREDCLAIVHSVAQLAGRLGMTTTAEGVESSGQLDQVREAGCTEAQGYFFGRAEPLERLTRWFEKRRPELIAKG